MRAYPARLATPSCTRAPPESLMKTNGEPVFSEDVMVSAILPACTSPAEPPATVKSWLATCTSRPSIRPLPVTTPSAGRSLPSMPNKRPLCLANRPASRKDFRSRSRARRSRADSLPDLCCFSRRSPPPPSCRRCLIRPSSRIRSLVTASMASIHIVAVFQTVVSGTSMCRPPSLSGWACTTIYQFLRAPRRIVGQALRLGRPPRPPLLPAGVAVSEDRPRTVYSPAMPATRSYGTRIDSDHDASTTLNRDYRSEEHTSELQSPCNIVCRLLLEKNKHTASKWPFFTRTRHLRATERTGA